VAVSLGVGGCVLYTGWATAVTVGALFFELSTKYLTLGSEVKSCPSIRASLKFKANPNVILSNNGNGCVVAATRFCQLCWCWARGEGLRRFKRFVVPAVRLLC